MNLMNEKQRFHLGVALPNYGKQVSPDSISDALSAAEDSGFDSAWVADHISVPGEYTEPYGNVTEALVTLGFAAGLTSRIKLGVSALVVPQREPVLTFKQIASLDFLAKGRLIVAVAAGWLEEEFELLGAEFKGRGKRLDGWIDFIASMNSQMPGPISHSGLVEMRDMWMSPAPPGDTVEMWSAGNSEAVIARAARLGTWHPVAQLPDHIAPLAKKLRKRNPNAHVIHKLVVSFAEEPDESSCDYRGRPSITGPPDWIAQRLSEYVAVGCDGFIVMLDPQEPRLNERIEHFAQEVWPRVDRVDTFNNS